MNKLLSLFAGFLMMAFAATGLKASALASASFRSASVSLESSVSSSASPRPPRVARMFHIIASTALAGTPLPKA